MTSPDNPIQGKGITPEAAKALGLESTDPRIVIDSDVVETDDGISDPFPSLYALSGQSDDVPSELSSGDQIPDVGIDGNDGGAERQNSAPPRRSISRLHKNDYSDNNDRRSRDATTKPPSLDEWQNFFSRIVLKTACQWYINYAFRGIDEDMLTDREVERLVMSDDERQLISTPLAELSNKSKFMRKHGRTIVATGDSFQAFVVLGAWMSRVNRIAAKYRPRNPRIRVNMNGANGNGSSGQSTPQTNGNSFAEGTTGGRVPNGYPIYRPGTG